MNDTFSFSGGRTSGKGIEEMLVGLLTGAFPKGIEFIYMDTGAEDPDTYKFIRKCVDFFGIELTCLHACFDQPIGKGLTVKQVRVEDLKTDLVNGPMAKMVQKYGMFTVKSAWCTSRLKEDTHRKYCDEKYGKGNYTTWLGIRVDEVPRLVGNNAKRHLSVYLNLRDAGYNDDEILEMFLDIRAGRSQLSDYDLPDHCAELFQKRLDKLESEKIHHLAEVCDYDKQDIIRWWSKLPFDLEIQEHLGNCVFCVKKSINKIALAARDRPELADQWRNMIDSASDRLNLPQVKDDSTMTAPAVKGTSYRGSNTLDSIIAKFSVYSRDELASTIRSMKQEETGSCTESCEAFVELGDE